MGGRPLTLPNGAYTLGMVRRRIRAKRFRRVKGLAEGVVAMVGDCSICDFGASVGTYVKFFQEAGLAAYGIDATPGICDHTNGLIQEADLSVKCYFGLRWDWGFSIEVGEHVPAEFAGVFAENIARHSRRGIILTWATPNIHGRYHVNPLMPAQVLELFKPFGFVKDERRTRILCRWCKDRRLRRRLLVLRRRRDTVK